MESLRKKNIGHRLSLALLAYTVGATLGDAQAAEGLSFTETIAAPTADTSSWDSSASVMKPVSAITTDIAAPGRVAPPLRTPPTAATGEPELLAKPQEVVPFAYAAAGTYHGGLLFQDVNLERHGHHYGRVQPAVSAMHFTSRAAVLPYSLVLKRAWKPTFTLGHGRPGDHTPPRVPLGR